MARNTGKKRGLKVNQGQRKKSEDINRMGAQGSNQGTPNNQQGNTFGNS